MTQSDNDEVGSVRRLLAMVSGGNARHSRRSSITLERPFRSMTKPTTGGATDQFHMNYLTLLLGRGPLFWPL